MNHQVHDFVNFICDNNALNTKEELIALAQERFNLTQDGKALYRNDYFCCRFCYSKNKSFSNVVLSLSRLEKYDHIPCFVVIVRKDLDNLIYMINSTFIDKISHSSQKLSLTNIRGSFLGGNIRKDISELNKRNEPKDFDDLFAYHQGFTWQENLERLVEKTHNIKPTKKKVTLTEDEERRLLDSPSRAVAFVSSEDYRTLSQDLNSRCKEVKDAIICSAHIENTNVRGRLIEVLITSSPEERVRLLKDLREIEKELPTYDTKNDIGDYVRSFSNTKTYTDIKTKVLYLGSNPKAYNIDKFLTCMSESDSVFMFYFVGIDESDEVTTALVSVYDSRLIDNTIPQMHWSGRGTRGSAQLNGSCINNLLEQSYEGVFTNKIEVEKSCEFLKTLLRR